MDMNEFNANLVRTKDSENIYLDFHPFGDRQGDALDSYFHEALESQRIGVGTFGSKIIFLLCDSTAAIPPSASAWLQQLEALGISIQIRRDPMSCTEQQRLLREESDSHAAYQRLKDPGSKEPTMAT